MFESSDSDFRLSTFVSAAPPILKPDSFEEDPNWNPEPLFVDSPNLKPEPTLSVLAVEAVVDGATPNLKPDPPMGAAVDPNSPAPPKPDEGLKEISKIICFQSTMYVTKNNANRG